jgi:hypothetical protein
MKKKATKCCGTCDWWEASKSTGGLGFCRDADKRARRVIPFACNLAEKSATYAHIGKGCPCWTMKGDKRQVEANNVRWHIVGDGQKLHASWLDGDVALCGVGPLGHLVCWDEAAKCKNCLHVLKKGGGA